MSLSRCRFRVTSRLPTSAANREFDAKRVEFGYQWQIKTGHGYEDNQL
jgi:hypothetical protein